MLSDPRPDDDSVPCELCSRATRMTGTKRCDACWEVERRLASFLAAPAARALVRSELAKVERIVAIEGGGDWADASVCYLVVPASVDLKTAEQEHDVWQRCELCREPQRLSMVQATEHRLVCSKPHDYMSFDAWLVARHGARYAETAGELEVYFEGEA